MNEKELKPNYKHDPYCGCGICAFCNAQEDVWGNPVIKPTDGEILLDLLKRNGDRRVSVGDNNLAFENNQWVVWRYTGELTEPITLVETDNLGVACMVLTGHAQALGKA